MVGFVSNGISLCLTKAFKNIVITVDILESKSLNNFSESIFDFVSMVQNSIKSGRCAVLLYVFIRMI